MPAKEKFGTPTANLLFILLNSGPIFTNVDVFFGTSEISFANLHGEDQNILDSQMSLDFAANILKF